MDHVGKKVGVGALWHRNEKIACGKRHTLKMKVGAHAVFGCLNRGRHIKHSSLHLRISLQDVAEKCSVASSNIHKVLNPREVIRAQNGIGKQFRQTRHALIEGFGIVFVSSQVLKEPHSVNLVKRRRSGSNAIKKTAPGPIMN